MIKKNIKDFELSQICNSGQCFRMNQLNENKYSIIAYELYLEIEQMGDELFFSCTDDDYELIWHNYFDLDTDYGYVKGLIDRNDEYMMKAASFGSGIRILKQDIWEMIITFIISQQNNIPRIRKCVQLISEQFGEERYNFNHEKYYTFPRLEALAKLETSDLKNCNLGYRSRYIIGTAKAISNGIIDFRELIRIDYETAKKELMKLYGVGIKVAECICLFALHHVEAFPIDTHINDVLTRYYSDGFPFERYQGYAGIVQQYAFYYEVNKGKLK